MKTRAHNAALVSLLLLTVTSTRPVRAAGPSAADRATARQHMLDGRNERYEGDLQGALRSFAAADAIMGVPTTALEVARTQVALGLLVEADEALLRVVNFPKRADEPTPFGVARAKARVLRDQLRSRIPSLRILFPGLPEDATPTVLINGVELATGALRSAWRLNPGTHRVDIALGDFRQSHEVKLEEGMTRRMTVSIPKNEQAVAVTKPSDVGRSPREDRDASNLAPTLMWSGFGLALAGAAIGSVTGVIAENKHDRLDARCSDHVCVGQDAQTLDSARSYAKVSTVAFVIAGAGAAVGIAAWAWPSDAEANGSPKGAGVLVEFGPSLIRLQGRF